jgi:hypothetical protein
MTWSNHIALWRPVRPQARHEEESISGTPTPSLPAFNLISLFAMAQLTVSQPFPGSTSLVFKHHPRRAVQCVLLLIAVIRKFKRLFSR